MVTIELTEAELHLVRNALHSFMTTFGHDESEVLREVRRLLDKVDRAATPGPASA